MKPMLRYLIRTVRTVATLVSKRKMLIFQCIGTSDDSGEQSEDWYNSSEMSDDIPDPDLRAKSLYQDEGSLPKRLNKSPFKEGLIYTMTLSAKRSNPMLVQIIELKKHSFVYQCFFNQTSSAQTWHESGKDKTCSYADLRMFGD